MTRVILQVDLDNWRKDIECPSCGSLLQIDCTDVLYGYRFEFYVTCPVDQFKIELANLPYLVKDEAMRKRP